MGLDWKRWLGLGSVGAGNADALGRAEKVELPAVLVARAARKSDGSWPAVRSWLGGLPRLGGLDWPRDAKSGKPLVFLAQVDLGEVADCVDKTPLPSTGALAFFCGERPVVYVAEAGDKDSELPADAVSVVDAGYHCAGRLAWPGDPEAPKVFPRWPVELRRMGADGEPDLPRREYYLSEQELLAVDRPRWWHTAWLLADGLRAAVAHIGVQRRRRLAEASQRDAQQVARWEAWEAGWPAFAAYQREVEAWVAGHAKWEEMSAADGERFQVEAARARQEFAEYTRYAVARGQDLELTTWIEVASEAAEVYVKAPEALRRLWNEKYRLPPGPWHQIFGEVIDIQGNAAEEAESNYLLLRLSYDEFLHWGFGDNGAYHFFLAPEDLQARRWEKARMVFECH